MISRHAIGSGEGAATYHDRSFAQTGQGREADNYYLNEQAAAKWYGKGAALIGVEGKPVEREEFVAFLDGKMPMPGTDCVQDLRDNAVGDRRRAGQDFTISAPKSVSVLALVGNDERVLEAHQRANATTMEWFEANASVVRVRDGTGADPVALQAGNLLWASVTHETDRTNMPQLHNHNVIVAAVFDEDSRRWRSLTNDQLFQLRTGGDTVYKRELASHLRAAGYELEVAKNGVDFEIAGLTREQLVRFSPRSEAIDNALRAKGIDPETASFEARQAAALASRDAKLELPREELRAKWSEAADEVGLDPQQLAATARERGRDLGGASVRAAEAGKDASEALTATLWAIEHLSEREQTFKSTEIQATALRFSSEMTIGPVAASIERLRSQGALIDRGADAHGARLFTTPRGRSIELQLASNLAASRGRGDAVIAHEGEFAARLAAYELRQTVLRGAPFKLSAEQTAAAKAVLMHPDAIQGIQGEAGTGKTAALAFVRDVAESKGWRVQGVATSATAADELARSSGIPSRTVASFFADKTNQARSVAGEISRLEETAEKQRAIGMPAGSLIESRTLEVKREGTAPLSGTFNFDHRQGVVFRARAGILGVAGVALLDFARKGSNERDRPERPDEFPSSRGEAGRTSLRAAMASRVGLLLAGFHKVEGVDAVSAARALADLPTTLEQRLARQLGQRRAELRNVTTYGDRSGRRTLLVMDETSLTGAADLERLTSLGRSISARTVLQGDTKQHGSPAAGRAFAQAQQLGMNTSVLRETMRFREATLQVKEAQADMQRGQFASAYGKLDTLETSPDRLAGEVGKRYVDLLRASGQGAPVPGEVGIAALTNLDRKAANQAVHDRLKAEGLIDAIEVTKEHFDRPKLTKAEHRFAAVLRSEGVTHLVFHRKIEELRLQRGAVLAVNRFDTERNLIHATTRTGRHVVVDPGKQDGFNAAQLETRSYSVGDRVEAREALRSNARDGTRVANGSRGRIESIDQNGLLIQWDDGRKLALTNDEARGIDHGYARTTFKEQGATNKHELLMVSEKGARIFNREAAYVGATRAKTNTEIITSSRETMLRNAGERVDKTTALAPPELRELIAQGRSTTQAEGREEQREAKAAKRQELLRD